MWSMLKKVMTFRFQPSMVSKMVLSIPGPRHSKNVVLLLTFLNGFLKIVSSVTNVRMFALTQPSVRSWLIRPNWLHFLPERKPLKWMENNLLLISSGFRLPHLIVPVAVTVPMFARRNRNPWSWNQLSHKVHRSHVGIILLPMLPTRINWSKKTRQLKIHSLRSHCSNSRVLALVVVKHLILNWLRSFLASGWWFLMLRVVHPSMVVQLQQPHIARTMSQVTV